jgi:hypothetical protein
MGRARRLRASPRSSCIRSWMWRCGSGVEGRASQQRVDFTRSQDEFRRRLTDLENERRLTRIAATNTAAKGRSRGCAMELTTQRGHSGLQVAARERTPRHPCWRSGRSTDVQQCRL